MAAYIQNIVDLLAGAPPEQNGNPYSVFSDMFLQKAGGGTTPSGPQEIVGEDIVVESPPKPVAAPPAAAPPEQDKSWQRQHKGMFGVKGTFRDILGLMGDAFLVQSGNKPVYAPQRKLERMQDAMDLYLRNPTDGIAAMATVDPDAAYRMDQNIIKNRIEEDKISAEQAYRQEMTDLRKTAEQRQRENTDSMIAKREADIARLTEQLRIANDRLQAYQTSVNNSARNATTNERRLEETTRSNKAREEIARSNQDKPSAYPRPSAKPATGAAPSPSRPQGAKSGKYPPAGTARVVDGVTKRYVGAPADPYSKSSWK